MMPGISVWRGLVQQCAVRGAVGQRTLHTAPACRAAEGREVTGSAAFDTSLLQVVVCPLSKKPVRYDESTNELINDELGIAYPIVDGIPYMIPEDARMIHREQKSKESDDPQQ